MQVFIDISITDDDILEGNETFILTLSQDLLSSNNYNNDINIAIGYYAQTTVTIVDTTSKCYNQ